MKISLKSDDLMKNARLKRKTTTPGNIIFIGKHFPLLVNLFDVLKFYFLYY